MVMALAYRSPLKTSLSSSLSCDAALSRKGLTAETTRRKCRATSRFVGARLGKGKCLVRSADTFRRDAHCSDISSPRIHRNYSHADLSSNRNSRIFCMDNSNSTDDGGLTQIIVLLFLCLLLLTLPWASEHPAILLIPVVLSATPGIGPAFMQPLAKEAFTWLIVGSRWLFGVMCQRRPSPGPAAHTAQRSRMTYPASKARAAAEHRPSSAVHPSKHVHGGESIHGHGNDSHVRSKEHTTRRTVDLMSNLDQL